VIHTSIPAFRRLRQENLQFEASLAYIASSRTAWATRQDLVLKKKKKERKKRRKEKGRKEEKKNRLGEWLTPIIPATSEAEVQFEASLSKSQDAI
jgi:hypothetical protein